MDRERRRKWKYREASTRNIARHRAIMYSAALAWPNWRRISKARRFTGVYFVNDDWPLWINEDVARDGAGMLCASNIDENDRDTRQVDEIRAPFRACYAEFGWLRSPAAGIARVLRFEIDVREVHRRAAVPFFVFPCLTMRSYTQLGSRTSK